MTRTDGAKLPPGTYGAAGETHAMTLRLDRTLADRLNLAVLATGPAASEIIRTALREHLTRLESAPEHQARYEQLAAAVRGGEPE